METPLMEASDLSMHFTMHGSFLDRLFGHGRGAVRAVDDVSLLIRRGEVLGLVGESGSGKTTLGRTLLRLLEPTGGTIRFQGRDISHLGEAELRPLRRQMQIVFQDPHASLNPAMDILSAVGHPLQIHGMARGREDLRTQVAEALRRVELTPVEQFMNKYPSELSGGQKQRVVLARAIILAPDLLVADEPVSMLDMSVRAKILELMLRLKDELGLTYLYITHDLATAKFFCDRIAIMYLGRIVEIGPADSIFAKPRHPYTVSLMRAIPDPDPARGVPRDLPRGEIPDAVAVPSGCPFHPRCPEAFEVCGWDVADLEDLLERRWTALATSAYEAEKDLVGDLAGVEPDPERVAVVPAGKGHSGEEVLELLLQVRREAPEEPFWRGVTAMEADPNGVRMTFRPFLVPRLVPEGPVQVACHLFDPEARALAEAPATA